MEIRTLEGTSIENILEAFNDAFRNYYVPLQLTPASLAAKIKSERISLPHSIGAFDGSKLAGFILHGVDMVGDNKTVYNGGTGVIPEHRGKKLTEKMYKYAFERLSAQNIFHHVLEVIAQNEPAKNVYERVGFRVSRTLDCFKGHVENSNHNIRIEETSFNEVLHLAASFDITPTWQQTIASLEPVIDDHTVVVAKENNRVAGYALFHPVNGRVKQFAVDRNYRRKGIGRALFSHVCEMMPSKEITLINVDRSGKGVSAFLKSIGLESFLPIYEMKYDVTS